MKIECLTAFKDTEDGKPTEFHLGDICTVPDEDGARFCAAGWARDVSGEVATGEVASGSADLDIHPAVSGHSSNTVGG